MNNDKIKICLWASVQETNIGVNGYGTEEENMFSLCDVIEGLLNKYGVFEIYRNEPHWTLSDNVWQEHEVSPDFVIESHSNADGNPNSVAGGTEIYCNLKNEDGLELAQFLYNNIAPLSEGKDRGIKNGMHLYDIRKTRSTAVLIEHFFHDNPVEVAGWRNKLIKYGEAVEKGICEYLGIEFRCYEEKINKDAVLKVLNDAISKLEWIKRNL